MCPRPTSNSQRSSFLWDWRHLPPCQALFLSFSLLHFFSFSLFLNFFHIYVYVHICECASLYVYVHYTSVNSSQKTNLGVVLTFQPVWDSLVIASCWTLRLAAFKLEYLEHCIFHYLFSGFVSFYLLIDFLLSFCCYSFFSYLLAHLCVPVCSSASLCVSVQLVTWLHMALHTRNLPNSTGVNMLPVWRLCLVVGFGFLEARFYYVPFPAWNLWTLSWPGTCSYLPVFASWAWDDRHEYKFFGL